MHITTEPVEPRQLKITLVVPDDEMGQAMERVGRHLSKGMRLPGYRPGHAPLREVVAHHGEKEVRREAMELILKRAIRQVMDEQDAELTGIAEFNVEHEQPLTLAATVALAPEVTMGDYRRLLRVPAPDVVEPTDDDVTAVIERLRADLAYLEPIDRPADEGDVLVAALVGSADDKIVFDDEDLTVQLNEKGLLEARLPPSALIALKGHEAGDEFDFTATYPDTWQQRELRGRAVEFTARVVTVAEVALPEVDNDFASQVSDAETIDELRRDIRVKMQTQAAIDARNQHAEAALEALSQLVQVSYAPLTLDEETAQMVADVRQAVERQGFILERWLELQGKDMAGLWEELAPKAAHRLHRRLVIAAFARAEGIAVPAAEAESAATRIRRQATPDERRSLPPHDELKDRVAQSILADRVVRQLLEVASGARGHEVSTPAPTSEPGAAEPITTP